MSLKSLGIFQKSPWIFNDKYPWILVWAKQIFIWMFSFCFSSKIVVGIPVRRWFLPPISQLSLGFVSSVFWVFFKMVVGCWILYSIVNPCICTRYWTTRWNETTNQPWLRSCVYVCVCVHQ
jgi:hypothetical protein